MTTKYMRYQHPNDSGAWFMQLEGQLPPWAVNVTPVDDPDVYEDEAELAFTHWCESSPPGIYPNSQCSVDEAILILDAFIAGYESAKAKYERQQKVA